MIESAEELDSTSVDVSDVAPMVAFNVGGKVPQQDNAIDKSRGYNDPNTSGGKSLPAITIYEVGERVMTSKLRTAFGHSNLTWS